MTSRQIRRHFLDFFASKGHKIIPSAPIVAKSDPTLMFINSGMAPLKDFFLGNQTPPASTLQISFRVDTRPPVSDLRYTGPSTTTITQTVQLSGVISDTGSVAAGVQSLEVDLVPSGQMVWNMT